MGKVEVLYEAGEVTRRGQNRWNKLLVVLLLVSCVCWSYALVFYAQSWLHVRSPQRKFYHHIVQPQLSCATRDNQPISYAGHIGLDGDSQETPKRSFFWYFEAESQPEDAPIILNFGGGPGTSGLMNGFLALSPCTITSSGPVHNTNRWTEQFNLILLDHPINVGFSYGRRVNNSHDAALDVYDFLQKFFRLFPQLKGNKLIIAGGSYGGVYVPNIASVIHEQNKAIAVNKYSNLIPINLDSMMVSNPITVGSNPLVHYQWAWEYRCNIHQLHNSTTCSELSSIIPRCLEMIELAYQFPTVEYRAQATENCFFKIEGLPLQGDVVREDIRRTCKVSEDDDPTTCHPHFKWMNDFFNSSSVKKSLGIPVEREFIALNVQVAVDFHAYGDLFVDRVKLLPNPFQEEFLAAPEFIWNAGLDEKVTIRQAGNGAGNLTFMLIDQAGHFVRVLVSSLRTSFLRTSDTGRK
ncbi:hypothetical protein Clacol_003994 [Clathrus columnatus]|uniref:carboxypeptidase C n=1 Tax=Clathrus columnatus TaxID=1419009 RepID=A0AAV5AA32_9AGAM|nr:hypothetical protein Clacol_003994 [Clathrus columnatus]